MNQKLLVKLLMDIIIPILLITSISYAAKSIEPIYQETITVDLGGNGDYTTITDAVKNAESLSRIEIKPGIYKENSITINKKITIIGETPYNTIIDFDGKEGFKLESTYVEIHNIKIINTKDYAISTSAGSDYCNISNCIIETQKPNGINIYSKQSTILNCKIISNQSYGQAIKIQGEYNFIKTCTVNGFGEGVLILIKSNYNKIINCNTFNNKVGVDIRIGSKNNIISNCNIYGNEIGIKIWQDSKSNSLYLNNFWKNDKDAIDEDNNTWDNGAKGNYWDQYTGIDADGDGIGDTPYVITSTTSDRYPLIEMILPSTITVPSNIKLMSSMWEDTPSFTWDQSIYYKEIKGYYVKIGSNPETFIGKTTTWASPTAISNGVHTLYIRAQGTDDTSSDYGTLTFYIDTTFIDADNDGWSDEEEQQYQTNPNDSDNYPLDTDNDHMPDSVDTDDDNDGYSDIMELAYGTNPVNIDSYPADTDDDGIPNTDSPDGIYKGDVDDDNDGLVDTVEINLGSNSRDPTDVVKIFVKGTPYYLIDISNNGVYDLVYNPSTGHTSGIEKFGTEYYRLDINGDSSWDYIYQPSDGSIVTYTGEQPGFSTIDWFFIIISLALAIFIIFFYLFKIRSQRYEPSTKNLKIKRYPVSKKPFYIQPTDAKDTVEMIDRTSTLLQNIQQDVQVYMEQLSHMKEQLTTSTMKQEPEKPTKETPLCKQMPLADEQIESSILPKENVESEVDDLLARLEKKQKY